MKRKSSQTQNIRNIALWKRKETQKKETSSLTLERKQRVKADQLI